MNKCDKVVKEKIEEKKPSTLVLNPRLIRQETCFTAVQQSQQLKIIGIESLNF